MREDITPDDIANDIRMTRTQFWGSFLIVEGQATDLRVYTRFIDHGACSLVPAHNKENAIQALDILEDNGISGVLAIVDADFWRLDGINPATSNLLLTDTHDLETMLIKSPAFEKLLDEFGSPTRIDAFCTRCAMSPREALLRNGCPIGYLRWISHRQDLSLKFEGITFYRFVDQPTLAVDTAKMIRTVVNKSQRHDLSLGDLLIAVANAFHGSHDPWDVCCGHDLVEILSLALRSTLGSNSQDHVRPEILEKSLRLAYESAHFSTTLLYDSIRTWESYNYPFKVLAS